MIAAKSGRAAVVIKLHDVKRSRSEYFGMIACIGNVTVCQLDTFIGGKGYALSEIPELTVSGWEKSRGHYIAMTNEAADSVGIGLYFNGSEKQCYCVMFIGDCLFEGELFGNYHM